MNSFPKKRAKSINVNKFGIKFGMVTYTKIWTVKPLFQFMLTHQPLYTEYNQPN